MGRTVLCWSSGKDSAWALHVLKRDPDVELVGLLTTANEKYDRAAMHAVRTELVQLQAKAAGLPLEIVPIPDKCSDEQYRSIMAARIAQNVARGITHMAFGDLYLEDIRKYREDQLDGTGVTPLFPLWGLPTEKLSREMLASGLRSWITCIDPKKLDKRFAGSEYNEAFLDAIDDSVDPCGENGEFHSFAFEGPMFSEPVPIVVGETVERDGYLFTDIVPSAV